MPDQEIVVRQSPIDGSAIEYVKMPDGKLRRMADVGEKEVVVPFPSTHFPDTLSDGSDRYWNEVDGIVTELADPKAREEWHRYAVKKCPDTGKEIEGPARFESFQEKAEYYRRFGFRDHDRDSNPRTTMQRFLDRMVANREQWKAKLREILARMPEDTRRRLFEELRNKP